MSFLTLTHLATPRIFKAPSLPINLTHWKQRHAFSGTQKPQFGYSNVKFTKIQINANFRVHLFAILRQETVCTTNRWSEEFIGLHVQTADRIRHCATPHHLSRSNPLQCTRPLASPAPETYTQHNQSARKPTHNGIIERTTRIRLRDASNMHQNMSFVLTDIFWRTCIRPIPTCRSLRELRSLKIAINHICNSLHNARYPPARSARPVVLRRIWLQQPGPRLRTAKDGHVKNNTCTCVCRCN